MSDLTHSQNSFKVSRDITIAYQSWTVVKPKAVIVIVHGLGEHSGRYMNIINEMSGKNVSFHALDHRGHGKSSSQRGHVNSFYDYIRDLKLFVQRVKDENHGLPLIMLGHSLGGAIAARYALTYQDDLSGLILSAPAFIPAVDAPKWKVALGRVISSIIPNLSLSNEIDANHLSHDKEVVENYLNDPLNHDKITARWYTEFEKNGRYCLERAGEIRVPLLIFHGTGDKLCAIKGSELFFERAGSSNKNFEVFQGMYHETMNESGKDKVLAVVSKWVAKLTGKNAEETKTVKAAPAEQKTEKAPKAAKKAAKKAVAKKPAEKKAPKAAAKKATTEKKAAKKATAKKATAKKTAKKSSAK